MKYFIMIYSFILVLMIHELFSDPIHSGKKLISKLDSYYSEKNGLWETTSWWNSANILYAYLEFGELTGDTIYMQRVLHSLATVQPADMINDYYDDQGWWGIALLKAYETTRNKSFRKKAENLFQDMASSWDDQCGGGIYWKKDRNYKNAIANELFILFSIRLYKAGITKMNNKQILTWTEEAIEWFKNSGMINSQFLINDGLKNCRNNRSTTWTYNQGVIIGGLTEYYQITNDSSYLLLASQIADSSMKYLSSAEGILKEPCEPECNGDQTQFKGIYIRFLSSLALISEKKEIINFIKKNAVSIDNIIKKYSTEKIGVSWQVYSDQSNASTISSALEAINAYLKISNKLKIEE